MEISSIKNFPENRFLNISPQKKRSELIVLYDVDTVLYNIVLRVCILTCVAKIRASLESKVFKYAWR